MPVTVIRQLQPRSRPTDVQHPAEPPGQPPPRPTGAVRATLGFLGTGLVLAGVVTSTMLVHQLWWLDAAAAERSEDLIVTIRQEFVADAAAPRAISSEGSAPAASASTPAAPTQPVIVHLPTIGETQPVLDGVGADVLDLGILGRYPGSAPPGEVGTFAVAGHRTTYGRPLWALGDLVPGDPVVVETAESYFVYEVRSLAVVRPEDTSVLAPVPGRPGAPAEEASMVLTTCHPRFSAAERLVAVAELDRTVPRSAGAPPELEGRSDPASA